MWSSEYPGGTLKNDLPSLRIERVECDATSVKVAATFGTQAERPNPVEVAAGRASRRQKTTKTVQEKSDRLCQVVGQEEPAIC